MICATLKEAKAKLNRLVEKAAAGEEVVLMRGSKHVAAIIPISEDDICFSPRLSDGQARRLWDMIDAERKSGKLRELKTPEDILR